MGLSEHLPRASSSLHLNITFMSVCPGSDRGPEWPCDESSLPSHLCDHQRGRHCVCVQCTDEKGVGEVNVGCLYSGKDTA